MAIALGEKGLRAATLPQSSRQAAMAEVTALGADAPATDGELGDLPQRLRLYARGEAVAFPDRLDLSHATPFLRAVWQATREIPRGQTRPYSWLAQRVGRPGAARAVGQAMRRNPLPIVIPCHRVVAADGGLGGYGGGLDLKHTLLRLEGAYQSR
ncbi:MAG: methylated-DNA--[protein]-cysteine S-methyltransferase [Dehalococcoidia bacterium]